MFSADVRFDKGVWISLATLHDCRTALKNEENPFGEVVDGRLDISAPLERVYPAESEGVGGEGAFPVNHRAAKVRTENAGVKGRGFVYAVFDTLTHAERARGRELYAMVGWKHVRAEEYKGLWETEDIYHGVIVARVEGEQNVHERLGKIPFTDKDFGACTWMSDGGLVERSTLV